MNIILEITNIDEINPAEMHCAVILSDRNPVIQFKPTKEMRVESNLWYPYQKVTQNLSFTSYLAEKLNIHDVSDSKQLIDDWNIEIQFGTMTVGTFDRIITIGKDKYGVIHDFDDNGSIVMLNRQARYPWQEARIYGHGYSWAYLDAGVPPSDADLKKYFNLNKAQCKSFKRQW